MKKPILLFFLLLVFIQTNANSQTQFDLEKLNDPKKYGEEIAKLLQTQEVYEYKDTISGTLFLKNGFRSSNFLNENQWLEMRDTVEVYRIDVIYSKYPLRKGTYQEIYPLLFNRLKNLFELDEDLNKASVSWNKILQTHCVNDAQVDQLQHGVLIWYRPIREEVEQESPSVLMTNEERTAGASQSTTADFQKSVDYINSSSFFSDSLKSELKGKTIDQQRSILVETLEKELKTKPNQDLTKVEKIERKRYLKELNTIIGLYTADSTVYKVFSRHPEWKNVLVVNDWTGSMYGYGGQVIQWHILNREVSGIKQITLFNDGDMKPTSDKKIGSAGGIYIERADNIERLIHLFQLVMTKGGGGDGPENDIEAILATISDRDSISEIVLIGDNFACVRDISLADRIPFPVRVIVCGYKESYGINPDLVYLAKVTNGGLYTIEEDLENLQVSYNSSGEITSSLETRFKVSKRTCNSIELITFPKMRMSLRETRFHPKKEIRSLDLSKNGITDINKHLYKLIFLEYLDLSENNLLAIDPSFGNLTLLRYLNLSNNHLTKLPNEFKQIHFLKELNLSNNKLYQQTGMLFNQPFLEKLNLSGNQLKSLSKVSNLRKLQECNLSKNQLKELPFSFQTLKSLKMMNLSENQLASFPIAICKLKTLEELDLRSNLLKTIPAEASGMKSLKIMHLEGNLFPVEEQEHIRKQFPDALVYF